MSAPFRITRPRIKKVSANQTEELKNYAERLTKLIPAEVLSVYLIGKSVLADDGGTETPVSYWIGWTIACFFFVVISRWWGTTDPGSDNPKDHQPQFAAMGIACVSFLVWIYSMGDVFVELNLYDPQLGLLVMLGWTFVVPYFYKGD